jgi:hypothetical protein
MNNNEIMTGGDCGCANVQMTGGGSYVDNLVNLAIPIGFYLAKTFLNKNKNNNKNQEIEKKENNEIIWTSKGGASDITQSLQSLSYKINNALQKFN